MGPQPIRQVAVIGTGMVRLGLTSTVSSYFWRGLCTDPGPRAILQGKLAKRDLGVKSGRGLYDWSQHDPEELKDTRDACLIARLKDLYPPRPQR